MSAKTLATPAPANNFHDLLTFKPFTKTQFFKPRITRRIYKTKTPHGVDTYALDLTVTGHNAFRMAHIGAHLTREVRRLLKQKQPSQIFENSDPDFESSSSDIHQTPQRIIRSFTVYFDVNLDPMFCIDNETEEILREKSINGGWIQPNGNYGSFDEKEGTFKANCLDKNRAYFKVECFEEPITLPDLNLTANLLCINGKTLSCSVIPVENENPKINFHKNYEDIANIIFKE